MSMPTRVPGTAVFLNADPRACPRLAAQPDAQQGAPRAGGSGLSPGCFDRPMYRYRSGSRSSAARKFLEPGRPSVRLQGTNPDIPAAMDQALCEAGLECSPLDTLLLHRAGDPDSPRWDRMAFWREKLFIAHVPQRRVGDRLSDSHPTAWWNWSFCSLKIRPCAKGLPGGEERRRSSPQ